MQTVVDTMNKYGVQSVENVIRSALERESIGMKYTYKDIWGSEVIICSEDKVKTSQRLQTWVITIPFYRDTSFQEFAEYAVKVLLGYEKMLCNGKPVQDVLCYQLEDWGIEKYDEYGLSITFVKYGLILPKEEK